MAWNKTKAAILYVVLLAVLYGSFDPGEPSGGSGGFSGGGFGKYTSRRRGGSPDPQFGTGGTYGGGGY